MPKLRRQQVQLQPSVCPPNYRFKVLQWNILADGLAQNGDFVKVPPEALTWEYRKPMVIQEIQESQADIICLQELNHYDEVCAMLGELGYTGAFFAKYCSPAERYKCPPDGLAIFYRHARFDSMSNAKGHAFLDDKGQKQSQGFLHVLLRDRVAGNNLLVATTHLKAKEGAENDAMRLQQAEQLLGALTRAALAAHSHTASPPAPTPAQAQAQLGGDGSNGNGNGNGNGHADASGNGAYGSVPVAGSSNGAGMDAGGCGNAACSSVADSSMDDGLGPGSVQALGSSAFGAEAVARLANMRAADRIPVLITGDFNTTPGSAACKSISHHFLRLASIWSVDSQPQLKPQPGADASSGGSRDLGATCSRSTDGEADGADGSRGASRAADLDLGAASGSGTSTLASSSGEFSTWKFRSKGESKRIIDYVWFSEGSLRPLSRWRMLSEAEIGPSALPSAAYASDHIALCVELEWAGAGGAGGQAGAGGSVAAGAQIGGNGSSSDAEDAAAHAHAVCSSEGHATDV